MAPPVTPPKEAPGPTDRFVFALPGGIGQWLRTDVPSCERQLMLHILEHPEGCRVDVKALSQRLDLDIKELSKALFALNRSHSIRVLPHTQRANGEAAWACLNEHVADMADRADKAGVALTDPVGLCIASANLSAPEAMRLSALTSRITMESPIHRVPLFMDDDQQPFAICSSNSIRAEDPSWVGLAHCLVAFLRRRRHTTARPQ